MIISPNPKIRPGINPETKRAPTEIPVIDPTMIIRILGGMIGPRTEAEAITPALKSISYPFFFISGIIVVPSVEAADVADPVMLAKIMLATMTIWAIPPRNLPTNRSAKSTKTRVIPAIFISSPARMKKGMAIKENMSNPLKYLRMASCIGASRSITPTRAVIPIENPIGTPIMIVPPKMMAKIIDIILLTASQLLLR
jgi:hypothetical protein